MVETTDRKILMLSLFILLFLPLVVADTGHEPTDFEQAEVLINADISCDQLSEDQLVLLGEYAMEQMHPENHNMMDEMMGGDESFSLRQGHIAMAQSFYCSKQTNGGMHMMNYGMMSGTGWFGMLFSWLLFIALAAFIFGIIFWWTYTLVVKEEKKVKK